MQIVITGEYTLKSHPGGATLEIPEGSEVVALEGSGAIRSPRIPRKEKPPRVRQGRSDQYHQPIYDLLDYKVGKTSSEIRYELYESLLSLQTSDDPTQDGNDISWALVEMQFRDCKRTRFVKDKVGPVIKGPDGKYRLRK